MSLHFEGLILAFVTVATIGIGHVLVLRLHPIFGVKAGPVFWAIGLLIFYASLIVDRNLTSSVLGLIAITFIWDGIEFFRQEKRVQREKQDRSFVD